MGTQAVTFPSCFGMATLSRQTQCPLFLQSLRLYHCLCYDESLDCLDNKNESKRKALAGYCKTELAFCDNLINILLLHFSTDYFYLLKKSRLRNSQFFSREHCETVEATKTLPPPPLHQPLYVQQSHISIVEGDKLTFEKYCHSQNLIVPFPFKICFAHTLSGSQAEVKSNI